MINSVHVHRAVLPFILAASAFFITSCDEFIGTDITYRNNLDVEIDIFTDRISSEYFTAEGVLRAQYEAYDHEMGDLDPGETHTWIHDVVYGAEPDDLFVVTAVNNNDEIVYQEVFTAGVLKDENHVVVIRDIDDT